MRGHIVKRHTKRFKNNWSIVIELGIDPATKKRKQQWFSFTGTEKEAEKRLTELLHQLDTGTFVQPGKTTLGEYLTRWLKDYKQNLSARGFERYRDIVTRRLIPGLGSIPLTQLKPEHLQRYYASQLDKDSPGTVRYSHAVLHVALKEAAKLGMLYRNVADAVTPPRLHNGEMKTWSEDEVNHFLEVAKGSAYYELFYLALFTGMRRSELLGLRWGDVDLLSAQIQVRRGLHQLKDGTYTFTEPKSASSKRTIALTPSTSLMLKEYRERQDKARAMLGIALTDSDLVFCHIVDGKPLRPNSVTRAWETLAARAGVKVIRLHDARHTHASLMLKQGIHPKIVQERLGHASIQMTLDTYSHVAPGLQGAAAARFDEGLLPRQKNEDVKKR